MITQTEKRIFAANADDFAKELKIRHISDEELSVRYMQNAVILPLRKNKAFPEKKNAFQGGVCDHNFRFLAGSSVEEPRFSCPESYEVSPSEIRERSETVIFGGVFFHHFGIMLLLSLTRFWWIIQNLELPYRLIFLSESEKAEGYLKAWMELLKIPDERYEVLKDPAAFREVIVPDEVLTSTEGDINQRFFEPFTYFRDMVLSEDGTAEDQKIYLSRKNYTKYWKDGDGLNEEYYEDFFQKRGFTVIHPQELSLREQIRRIASAKVIAGTYGTLSHLCSLFAMPGTKLYMLLRSGIMDPWFSAEAAILEKLDLDWYIIESVKNPYPVMHEIGVYLYAPTEYFRNFLMAENIPFAEEELTNKVSAEMMKEFLTRWLSCYGSPWGFKRLGDPGLFPVLQALTYHMTKKKLDPKDYLEPAAMTNGKEDPVHETQV